MSTPARPSLRLARASMRSHGLVRVGGMDEVFSRILSTLAPTPEIG